jgi:PAS domain S-box-containing protein
MASSHQDTPKSSGTDDPVETLRAALRRSREREEQLLQSEGQLRDFLENANIGLHRVGPDGTILWANRADMDLLGYAEGEYLGKPVSDFHVDRDVIADILARLARGEALHDYEARLRAKDQSIKHVLINSSAYFVDGRFIHTRCFTRDITERRKVEEAVRESGQQLRAIVDGLPVLVAFVDTAQRYQFVSAAYERWFGSPKDSLVGRHIAEVVGPEAYGVIERHVAVALSGVATNYEAAIPFREGGSRFVEATYVPHLAPDGSVAGFVALVADVTERKKFERLRAEASARADRLLKVTAAIADAVSAEQVFEALVDRLGEAVEASSAGLWLLHEASSTARLARASGYTEEVQQRLAVLPLSQAAKIPVLDAIQRGEPIWIPSRAAMFERYPHLDSLSTGDRAYRVSCLPLIAHGQVIGALGLTIEAELEAGHEERDFLMLVARYSGQAIERLRLLEAERQSRREASTAAARLRVLGQASRTFGELDLGLEGRLRGVAGALAGQLASCINIALLEPDGLLHMKAVRHPNPDAQTMLESVAFSSPLRVGEGVTGAVVVTGKSVLVPKIDARSSASRAPQAYREFLERFPAYAMIGAPLRARGRVIGTVTATRVREGESFTADDLSLLEDLGERAAVAIENSRLYQETLDARSRAEQLHGFAQAVVGADGLEEVFEAALTSAEAVMGGSRAAILTFDGDDVMRFRSWHGLSDEYRAAVDGHSPWPRTAASPEPIVVTDAQSDATMAPHAPLLKREGIRGLAFIPLLSEGRLLGNLTVCFDQDHASSSPQMEAARALANHLASVITRFAAVRKLEETIRYNELFAGALAHDLRNPLDAIMTASQLALIQLEGAKVRVGKGAAPLTRIVSSGKRMQTMIDQLLDFTQARSGGGIDVQPRLTNLADLCTQAVVELELTHPEWKVHTEALGDQNGSWDADRIVQVFSNLIANAGQHGSPNIAIQVHLDGTDGEHVRIEIRNGGAIPTSLLPHIFDPFRTTRSPHAKSSGLGLGLFIVREIVRAHGGSIDVSSSDLDGTSFAIRLPRHRSTRPADRT